MKAVCNNCVCITASSGIDINMWSLPLNEQFGLTPTVVFYRLINIMFFVLETFISDPVVYIIVDFPSLIGLMMSLDYRTATRLPWMLTNEALNLRTCFLVIQS